MMTSAAETPSPSWMSTGMPRPSSVTSAEPSALQDHPHIVGMAGQRLVDGVVDDLVDHVVQARAVVGVADIHARALAHGVQPLQHLDRFGVVAAVLGGLLRLVGWSSGPSSKLPCAARTEPLEPASVFPDNTVRDLETLGAVAERIEQGAVRSCEPGLAAERGQFVVESGPSIRIEMGRRLVQ